MGVKFESLSVRVKWGFGYLLGCERKSVVNCDDED